ncbi:hypothetical protein GCM10023346_05780 [Arthrobacter gyeryongensis]|uniref:Uncharacterized protein n=1 Tax=Arthrobacter gyeryongensis TaxID=1650592 RepID=A0ABP9S339_9MICC
MAKMAYNHHLGLNVRVLFPCPRVRIMAPPWHKLTLLISYMMPLIRRESAASLQKYQHSSVGAGRRVCGYFPNPARRNASAMAVLTGA